MVKIFPQGPDVTVVGEVLHDTKFRDGSLSLGLPVSREGIDDTWERRQHLLRSHVVLVTLMHEPVRSCKRYAALNEIGHTSTSNRSSSSSAV